MARPISRLLDTLASTLTALREALTPAAPSAKTAGRKTPSRRGSPRKTKPVIAPKAAAAPATRRKAKAANQRLALQGRYMAAVRGLSAANKAKVKKVLAEKGVEAAIALAVSKKS